MIKKQRLFQRAQGPMFPLALGTSTIPANRASVGIAQNVYGTGPKRKLRKTTRVLGQINSFLKKSKLISTVGAPLAALLPPGYNVAGEALVGLARKQGYGVKTKKGMCGAGRKKDGKPSNLRLVKEGLKKVNNYLKSHKIISKYGAVLNKNFVPEEYRPYTDSALKVAKNLGYGAGAGSYRRGMMNGRLILGKGVLRNQGAGKKLPMKRMSMGMCGGALPYRYAI